MKLVRCKCGVTHECAARMSNRERAQRAAAARGSITKQGIQNAITNYETYSEKVEAAVAATKAIQRGLPNGMCPHNRDPKFCTIQTCVEARSD